MYLGSKSMQIRCLRLISDAYDSFLSKWGTPFGPKGVSVRVYGENSIKPLNFSFKQMGQPIRGKKVFRVESMGKIQLNH